MNKWIGMGRATKDADVRYTSGEKDKWQLLDTHLQLTELEKMQELIL